MTTLIKTEPSIIYPSKDNTPLAETSIHLDVIINTVVTLRHHLKSQSQSGIVLSNQFVYYAQGFPKLRVAPDIAVVFNVPLTQPDNYKIWETGQVPSVVFEITSKSTQSQDRGFKKDLYESLGVTEYWLFDPRSEWLDPPLKGYLLVDDLYTPILNSISPTLGMRLEANSSSLDLYLLDNGQQLLAPDRLDDALQQSEQSRQQAERALQQSEEARKKAEIHNIKLLAQLESLGITPDIS
jgi:Uma2 family endonuclease